MTWHATIPIEGDPRWREEAACRGVDPNVFFPDRGDTFGVRAAKAICAGCPVRTDCLDYAITYAERTGIWGGKSERERRELRRTRAHSIDRRYRRRAG